MAETPEQEIAAAGFPVYLCGFSAIDSYLGRFPTTAVHVSCRAELADLARLFEGLRYPGVSFADAAVDCGGKAWYFRCADEPRNCRDSSFDFLEFFQDCVSRRFYDPNDIYPVLRRIRDGKEDDNSDSGQWWKTAQSGSDPYRVIFDRAMILARYFPEAASREINAAAAEFRSVNAGPQFCIEEQRLLLTGLLEAANPAPGFELLKSAGFISAFWPELAALDDVDHSKEFHPEGNVWKHTMETLRYRKAGHDLRLSLGLLLHDAGKPLSDSAGSRRFNGHAELGERQARRFLERLCFQPPLVNDVCYLVRNHMLPAALPRLPLVRTGEIMASPLFPTLLELYRCDESSSFKGLDGYYQSSAAYQSYLKYRRNPAKTWYANR